MDNTESKTKYKMLKKIGEGTYGKAYLVEYTKTKEICVIKTIFIDMMPEEEVKASLLEAQIMQKLDHPNIISFKDTFIMKKPKKSLCIVMDYADGGDLKTRIKNQKGKYFPEITIIDWFTQICLAIKHIHDRKILHRDLKSQNIFLTKNELIKLGDFGIAKCLDFTMQKASTFIGTPYYLSPEIVQNQPYSFKSDVWSLGVLLYEMCCLKMPYDANSLAELTLKIIKGQFSPIPTQYSKGLVMLINCLLCVDQNKRPSVNDILRLPIIKSRIKNFLNDFEYNDEFSHTILHKYNPLKKQPSKDSKTGSSVSITVSVNEERPSKAEEVKAQPSPTKAKQTEEKKVNSPRKTGPSPQKNLSPRKDSNSPRKEKGSVSPGKETQNKVAEEDKKLKVLMKSINTAVKNQQAVEKIEEKDNKDYINVHKMLVELSKIEKDDGSSTTNNVDNNYENLKKEVIADEKENDKEKGEGYMDADKEDNQTEQKKEEEKKEEVYEEDPKFEEMRTGLVSKLGEGLYNQVFQIVDENIPVDSFIYDHEKISKSIIKLAGKFDINLILVCIEKIQEFYSLVIKEREKRLRKK